MQVLLTGVGSADTGEVGLGEEMGDAAEQMVTTEQRLGSHAESRDGCTRRGMASEKTQGWEPIGNAGSSTRKVSGGRGGKRGRRGGQRDVTRLFPGVFKTGQAIAGW